MGRRATRKVAVPEPIDLSEERASRAAETQIGEAVRRSLARLVGTIAARWRGHEPEVAILATIMLVLAVAGTFAGADLLFTLLVVLVALVTVWSPWRRPN
jgi:hypothetical protein